MSINWSWKEIENNGFNIYSKKHYETKMLGDWQMREYAKSNNIRLEDVHGFRLSENDWVIVHKINPIKGYVEQPILNF